MSDRPEGEATVLVVDDTPNVAEAYALHLSEYDVLTATGGEEALDALDGDADVDVVLLDRRMPAMSGDEVLSAIRERGHDCRVAMVTAVDPDFDVVEMAFDAYLTKPVTRDEVTDTVERLLELDSYDETLREMVALNETRATLEAEKAPEELDDSSEYGTLLDRIDDLDDRLDRTTDEMDGEQFTAAFRTLGDDE